MAPVSHSIAGSHSCRRRASLGLEPEARSGRRLAVKSMTEEHFAILRRHMVEVIAIHADLSSEQIGKDTISPRVIAAMRKVPRHLFVPEPLALYAYHDMPLPIGF